jgi:hypothetical protein
MKTKKLVRKIKVLLGSGRRAQLAKRSSLEKVMRKLETKELALRRKLNGKADKEQRREIQQKLEVIEVQRKKGQKLMKELEELRRKG